MAKSSRPIDKTLNDAVLLPSQLNHFMQAFVGESKERIDQLEKQSIQYAEMFNNINMFKVLLRSYEVKKGY